MTYILTLTFATAEDREAALQAVSDAEQDGFIEDAFNTETAEEVTV